MGDCIWGEAPESPRRAMPTRQGVYQERFWTLSTTKITKFSGTDVSFTEEDANGVHFPHNDALVVEAVIGNHTVCRILVDNGSSVDILYSDCLEKMGIPKEQLETTSQSLYRFTRDSVIPQGTIRLPITAGEKPRHATTMANCMVIKGGSQYSAVIGQPTLQALKAITFIYHQNVKFPIPNGVGEIKSNQYESIVAYSDAIRGYNQPGKLKVDQQDPARILKIGSDLPSALRIGIEEFRKKNLDVFAWTHADMEGIDSQVMCHALNVVLTYPSKRQKCQPMNPERYEALKEEVDKLINNSFIREAHYPKWVSNPVLVKKPNGAWRTCVDFSDLNKAYLKDGLPLPRID
ncbi:uncharacterized protein LOC112094037 [Morus notabilis]|uniref:uncharacterized protein LOC112094037 n=1 Tax=Morus notabilis TaxID=981085 RepID=UPI000CED1DE9|nr:uncharacterized protein LOC112094037 [Morus notabilis]